MKIRHSHLIPLFILLLHPFSQITANVGGVSGSNQFTVVSDGTSTTWKIVSVSVTGDPIYSGAVASISDNNLTFSTGLDENNNTTYPFFASGSLNKDVQVPSIAPTVSGGAITALTVTYTGGFDSDLTGFTNTPEVIISPSDGGGTSATASLTLGTGLESGKVTGYTITEGGSSYTNTPDVQIVGGPHFARIIDEDSDYFGRVFLITNNSQTTVALDMASSSAAVSGETAAASTFFSVGTLVEIVPAATLSSVFGLGNTLVSGWDAASSYLRPSTGDSIFLATDGGGYEEYLYADYADGSSRSDGWYKKGSRYLKNNAVIYPDEAIIIAKRMNGTATFDIDIADNDSPARIFLPEFGSLFVANNPYGMKMLLAELIPSTSIGTGTNQFKPGATASTEGIDLITVLDGSGWTTYWYQTGDNDGGITEMMQAGSRAGSGGSNALSYLDLLIANGSITALTSWENSNSAGSVTGNDGNYTYISTTSPPSQGFKVTISDLDGFMLNDDGTSEMNATTGENVAAGSGSQVFSNINGVHEVLWANGSGFVIEKQLDVNHTTDGSHSAFTGTWKVGDLGTGYDGTAQWYAIGGNGTGAKGTVTTGGSFSVTSGGSGYTSAPQIVVSGGGWRISTDANAPKGGVEIGASDGIIIRRRHSAGVSAYIELTSVSD